MHHVTFTNLKSLVYNKTLTDREQFRFASGPSFLVDP